MNYICNIKKCKPDLKDYTYISSNINYPKELDYRKDLQPIRDQGNQGSCYAQSVACVKEWQEKKDINFNEYLSPQFFYNNRSNLYDNNKNNDYGMNSRDVMKLMKNIGICRESIYPYGFIQDKKNISKNVYKDAQNHIIKGYARINTINECKKNIFINGPCLITFPVFNYSKQFWIKKNNEKSLGGHAVVIVGYNNEGFIIRNSWGTKWSDNGYGLYQYKNWNKHWEIWTTIDHISLYNKKINNCCIII